MMKKYLIGKAAPSTKTKTKVKKEAGGPPFPLVAIGVAALAGAAWYFTQANK